MISRTSLSVKQAEVIPNGFIGGPNSGGENEHVRYGNVQSIRKSFSPCSTLYNVFQVACTLLFFSIGILEYIPEKEG
jgi:hypothetical protein